MLQIILIVMTVSASGERKTTGIAFDNPTNCYAAASHMLETIAGDFENLGLLSASVGCLVRPAQRPA